MYTVQVLGINEAMRALNVMLEEANKEPQRPLAFAIVDHLGELVCCARMDRTGANTPRVALRKAYTSARNRNSSKAWGEGIKSRGMSLSDYGDPLLIPFQGGLPIMAEDGTCLGGIGVSGRRAEEDEAVAEIGLKAMQLAAARK